MKEQYNSSNGVLVHCFAGYSRYVSFLIAYLMAKNKSTFEDVIKHVKKHRNIMVTEGFQKQLRENEKKIHNMLCG